MAGEASLEQNAHIERPYTAEEKITALERVLQSQTFAKSEQLKSFLRFICDAEIARPGIPLTEYTIGVEVLGRRPGYSPTEDSSVRTRAYELRHRLERLYGGEFRDEPVQICIPKGGYTPQFRRHVTAQPAGNRSSSDGGEVPFQLLRLSNSVNSPRNDLQDNPQVFSSPWPRGERISRFTLIIIAVVAIVSASLSVVATKEFVALQREKSTIDPILREAWGPLAKPGAHVLLCVGTPLTLVAGPDNYQVYGSSVYPAPPETYALFRQHRLLPAGAQLSFTFSDNMMAVGTTNAILTTARTLGGFGGDYQILPERAATASALRNQNAILFGAPVDSEAVSLRMKDMPLLVDYDPQMREFVIRDRRTNTLLVPKKNDQGDFTEVYGLITVLSGQDETQHETRTMLYSGITSVGSQGAAEFFSRPSSLKVLRGRLSGEGAVNFPAAYQVIVKCTYTNGLLLSYSYWSHVVVQR